MTKQFSVFEIKSVSITDNWTADSVPVEVVEFQNIFDTEEEGLDWIEEMLKNSSNRDLNLTILPSTTGTIYTAP